MQATRAWREQVAGLTATGARQLRAADAKALVLQRNAMTDSRTEACYLAICTKYNAREAVRRFNDYRGYCSCVRVRFKSWRR
jgi:hypothetical protein